MNDPVLARAGNAMIVKGAATIEDLRRGLDRIDEHFAELREADLNNIEWHLTHTLMLISPILGSILNHIDGSCPLAASYSATVRSMRNSEQSAPDVVDRLNSDPATEYAVYDVDMQCYMRDPYGYTAIWPSLQTAMEVEKYYEREYERPFEVHSRLNYAVTPWRKVES